MLATLAQAWPTLVFAGGVLSLVVLADFAAYRAVRRLERLVQVLTAMAMTVVTAIGLSFVVVIGGLGVLVALCPPDALRVPVLAGPVPVEGDHLLDPARPVRVADRRRQQAGAERDPLLGRVRA